MSSTMASTLMNIITTAQGELGKLGNASGATNAKTKTKKASARKGRPTPHGDFTKKILEEHKSAVETFKAELKESNPDQKGAHLIFVSNYKKAHMDEYTAFEAAWNETHPKEDSASEAASVVGSDAEATTEAPSKPKRVLGDEQKAKMKAGREKAAAEKKALKAAEEQAATTEVPATPAVITPVVAEVAVPAKKKGKQVVAVAAPVAPVVVTPAPFVAETTVATEEENEFIPFKHSATNYLRLGIKREDGNHLWASGDLWASKKGQKGAYIGCLQADGTIDKTAEEPATE